MRFADLCGHERAITRLQRAAAQRRVAGAYLLAGPPGVGKRTLATAFAACLLCAAPARDDACGTCPQCTRVASGTHPDLLVVAREADRRDIRIEQARELCRWLALRPLMAERKVAIVDGAEYLNEHGQSALLKTLEEPPGSSVLLLTSSAPASLLPTVRSRCQRVRLDPLPAEALTAFLAARDVSVADARLLAAQAEGSPGRALELVDAGLVRLRGGVVELLAGLAERSAAELSAAAQDIARGPVEAALAVVVAWYRDVLWTMLGDAGGGLRNPDRAEHIRAAAAHGSPATVLRQLEVACDTIQSIGRNANRSLALETMLLLLRHLERGGSSADAWTRIT